MGLDYLKWDLGQRDKGAVVQVVLEGNSANVRLLDGSNFRSFEAGRDCRFYGGHYNRSPVVLTVPNRDRWHVVVDYGGFAGRGKAAVQVLDPTV
jgi:Domain of unknown function (DUF1883)